MPQDIDELAYETAIRALDQQERLLEVLRVRAGTLLAASSLALSLLRPTTADAEWNSPLTVAVLLAFLASAGASLFVLVPRGELVLSVSPLSLYERLPPGNRIPYRQLVLELHSYRRRNDRVTRKLTEACRRAGLFLAIETFLLVAIRSADTI